MIIAVKEVGKELQLVDTDEKYRGACVKKYTGMDYFVEYVPLKEDGTLNIGVNEDGLRLELPTNFLVSMNNPHWPIQKMVGTVVFVRHKLINPYEKVIWDFEVESLTDDDIKLIRRLVSDDVQEWLKSQFVDYGRGYAIIEPFERIKMGD